MEHHLNTFFWSPTGSGSSNSNSSADTNESDDSPSQQDADALHVGDDLDEDFYPFEDNLPPFSATYMRTLLQSVNEKWDQEPCHLQEREIKVQFMPEESLVTITYFSEENESHEEVEPESAQPLILLDSTELPSDSDTTSKSEIDHPVPCTLADEEYGLDDFLEEEAEEETESVAQKSTMSKSSTSPVFSCVGSDSGTGSSSSNLIDLRSEGISPLKPESTVGMDDGTASTENAKTKRNEDLFSLIDYAGLNTALTLTLTSANSLDIRLDSLSSSTSEDTLDPPLVNLTPKPSVSTIRTEYESDLDPPQMQVSSKEKTKANKSLEVTGVKLAIKQEPESIVQLQPSAPAPQVTKVKVMRSSSLKTLKEPSQQSTRRQREGTALVGRTSPTRTTNSLSSLSSGSTQDVHFEAIIQAMFNKNSLLALNTLMVDPKRLAQVKAQILKRSITPSMLSNILRPELVKLLFEEDQGSRPLTPGSKWATKPLFRQGLDGAPITAGSKDGLASPSKSGSLKEMGKKRRAAEDGMKPKGPIFSRSLSAKEKTSKLKTVVAKLSPRPATTGSKIASRVNLLSRWNGESYTGTNNGINRTPGSYMNLNPALDNAKLADEKKAKLQDFHSWLDRKKKQPPPKQSTLSGDSDRWFQRMKLQTKKAENEILAKIRTDNNPRMMDAYRAYRFGGPNSIGTTNASTSLKKVTGKKVTSTHA